MDIGEVLADRYELVEEIGSGGMGRVVRAHDRTLGRDVAVKLLGPHLLGDRAAVEALRTEARLAAAVRHPNVVQVLDAVLEDTDQPAIVMEYVDGPSLREVVPSDGLDVERALQITAAVAAGLGAVHAAGLVHRDVTPGNVLLDHDVPRLTDFGIARSAAATSTRVVRGSVSYLAPEQASGAAVDARADVYGLACLATTLLTGEPPFAADRAVGVVHQHLHEPPPDVRDRRPDIPAGVATAIMAALAKDPADRPGSVVEFAAALGVGPGDVPAGDAAASAGDAATATTTVLPAAAETRVLPPDDDTRVLGDDGAGIVAAGGLAGAGDIGDNDDPARRALLVALAAVLVVAMVAGASVLFRGDDELEPTVAASPDATATTAAPAATPPPPSPAATTPPMSPTEATRGGLQDMRASLVDLRSDGLLGAEAVQKLDERLAKAIEELDDGEPGEVAKELREFRKELAKRADEGEVEPEAETALLATLLEVEAALAEVPRDQDDDDDDDDDEGRGGSGRGRGDD